MSGQCETAGQTAVSPILNSGWQPAAQAEPELDLDRLVWDPEYRDEMREALGRGG
ncbi:MAG: hypothetical protein ACE5GS_09005 [Kiloniellaceae bacterium]